MSRDLLKTLTFAAVHFSVAFSIAYLLTGSVPVATGLALVEPMVNTVAFYFHERVWRMIDSRPAEARAWHLGHCIRATGPPLGSVKPAPTPATVLDPMC
jgi:uncharacterized membrane protein